MALFHGDIFSETLQLFTPLTVYLPQDDGTFRSCPDLLQRTLIMLHGLGTNSSGWTRFSNVERYARERNIALVFPDGGYSFYSNMTNGKRYEDYIGKELPDLISRLFRVNTDRDSLYVAGLSMGGYGALKLAFTYPETFGRCASFSGALMNGDADYLEKLKSYADPVHGREGIEVDGLTKSCLESSLGVFGDTLSYRPENDIVRLAEQAVRSGKPLPKILMTCGTEDFLYEINRRYHDLFTQLGLEIPFHTWSGAHEWPFWEECVARYMDFFQPG